MCVTFCPPVDDNREDKGGKVGEKDRLLVVEIYSHKFFYEMMLSIPGNPLVVI